MLLFVFAGFFRSFRHGVQGQSNKARRGKSISLRRSTSGVASNFVTGRSPRGLCSSQWDTGCCLDARLH
jgi:hypothetical protein